MTRADVLIALESSAQRIVMPIEHAFTIAGPDTEFRAWLEWRRELGDPGPLYLHVDAADGDGLVWTELSEREEADMSHMLVEEPNAAVELGKAMNVALREFIEREEPLIRRACQVPADMGNLNHVVVCAFLGHTLEQLRLSSSRAHAEHVVTTVLEQLDQAESSKRTADEASH